MVMTETSELDCISVVVRHTLVQMLTPDRMRGRVSAISGIQAEGYEPAGSGSSVINIEPAAGGAFVIDRMEGKEHDDMPNPIDKKLFKPFSQKNAVLTRAAAGFSWTCPAP